LTDIGLIGFSAISWTLAIFSVYQDFWIRLIFNSYQSTSVTKMQKIKIPDKRILALFFMYSKYCRLAMEAAKAERSSPIDLRKITIMVI
jgi:hypothetical protein